MIDIHAHILPGLDDGPDSWEETLEMCRIARRDGITGIVASPHIREGIWDNTREGIEEKVSELNDRLDGRLDIEVLCGAEVHAAPNLAKKVKSGVIPTINDNGYMSLELPVELVPPHIEDLIFELRLAKIRPVIAHVERCGWIKREFERIGRFVEMGALIQITAMSMTGEFGRTARAMCVKLLKRGLVHVIASDCHDSGLRAPVLSKAVREAAGVVGEVEALKMVDETPWKIVRGEEIG